MAVAGSSWFFHFLVLWLFLWPGDIRVAAVMEFVGSCGSNINLRNSQYQSGILRMSMPASMAQYQDPLIDTHCDVTITFSHGNNMLIELYYLDIYHDKDGASGGCTTGLKVLNPAGESVYGQLLCMQAWEWEERHAMSKQEKKVIQSSPLIFRLESYGPYKGTGFKVHFNQFLPYIPCTDRYFKCDEVQRCVHDDLTCDGWDDCGDHTDEKREAGCGILTPSEICGLVIGILLFLGTVVAAVLFCVTYRRLRHDYGLRSESKMPIAIDRMSIDTGLSKRYNSQESMGTHYSRRNRRDSDSSIDKLELEKSDRLSNRYALDNGSERSYRSNPKSKARSLALGSEAGSEITKKSAQYSYNGGRRGRASSSNSLNKGEAPLKMNGIDNPLAEEPDLERDLASERGGRATPDRRSASSRRRDRDDYSDYSDDDDRRRRRRRSRDRRSRRYSDEDDDDDYSSDYERRRRRRRRSYSDDDDSYDSEYERERRRRRRSKERKRRSRDLDDDDPDREDRENSEDRRERRRRRDSRDRDRDSYDSEEEDRRRRRRRRSPSYDDDDDDRDRRRRRSRDRRRSPTPDRERELPESEKDQPDKRRDSDRNRDPERTRDTQKPRDLDRAKEAERMSRAIAKEVESRVPRQDRDRDSPQAPPPSTFMPVTLKEATPPPPEPKKATPQVAREPSPPPPVTVKQPSSRGYHPPPPQQQHRRPPPPSTPPTAEEIHRMEADRDRRRQNIHQNRLQRHLASSPPNTSPAEDQPVSPEEDDRTRRRSQDNRRERYSRDRWTPRGRRVDPQPQNSPPQSEDYEDINPRVKLDAPLAGYREETV